jgi:asparagine N-glycosylation enzyme membrane subunit Stt3
MRRIVRQAKQVDARVRSLFSLTTELAQLEAKRKAAMLGKAAGMGALAGVLVFYAIGFLLAAAAAGLNAAGLNETLALWLSLLIVGVALLVVAMVLVLLARRVGRRASPLAPTQAIDETKRTVEIVKSHG